MRLDELAQTLREFEARLVELGVSRGAARKAALDAECVAVGDMLETQADIRLVDLFEQAGCAALAERHGVARNTIYARRTDALARLAVKGISRRTEQLPAQEVA